MCTTQNYHFLDVGASFLCFQNGEILLLKEFFFESLYKQFKMSGRHPDVSRLSRTENPEWIAKGWDRKMIADR